LAHPPVDLVLRLMALGHRVLAVCAKSGAIFSKETIFPMSRAGC
jgi:hypothetical protein